MIKLKLERIYIETLNYNFLNIKDTFVPPNPNELESDKTKCDSFGYIEVGENSDDITHLGNPWDFDMYLNRSIDTPILKRKEKQEEE